MNKKSPTVVKTVRKTEFEVPDYLRTSWTSNDAEQFTDILRSLKESIDPLNDRDNYILGFKEVFKAIKIDSMRVLCVIACVDNGGDVRSISNICRESFLCGIPVVLGRGPRQLGGVFGKNRVGCAALSKSIAAKPEMLDFILNLSNVSSKIRIPLEDSADVIERFRVSCEGQVSVKRKPHGSLNKGQTPPPEKKVKVVPKKEKNTSFFASFD